MEYFEEITSGLFEDRLLDPAWREIAERYELSGRLKAVFYLHFGIGLEREEVCETLDLFAPVLPELIAEIYDKFDLESEDNKYNALLNLVGQILELPMLLELEEIFSRDKNCDDIDSQKQDKNRGEVAELASSRSDEPNKFLTTKLVEHRLADRLKNSAVKTFETIKHLMKLSTASLNVRYLFAGLKTQSSVFFKDRFESRRACWRINRDIFASASMARASCGFFHAAPQTSYFAPAIDKTYTKYLADQLENNSVPKTLDLNIVKPLFKRKCEVIYFKNFSPALRLNDLDYYRATATWFDKLGTFLADNDIYFIEQFFAMSEHHCLQRAIDWNASANSILERCCEKSIAHLVAGKRIENLAPWLRYVLFAVVSELGASKKPTYQILHDYCSRFQDYPVEKRSLLEEEVIDEVLKSLAVASRHRNRAISDWSSLWDYARRISVCTLTSPEVDTLLGIHLKALDDDNLNWCLNFLEREIILKIADVDVDRRLSNYRYSWINLKAAIAKQQEPIDSFDCPKNRDKFAVRDYIEHQRHNTFSSCMDLSSFLDNVDDRKGCLGNSLKELDREDLTFEQFEGSVSNIPFGTCVNARKLIFSDEKVHITHYTRRRIKLSIACWKGGQSIPEHPHNDKFDAIYVYRGTLEHVTYDSGVAKRELLSRGDIKFLDSMVVHGLSNYSLESQAVSVHVQWYKKYLSPQDIDKEYPDSVNRFAELHL